MIAAFKYLKQYFRPSDVGVKLVEASYTREGKELPATIYRPVDGRARKAWIVLHGLTYHGSRHPGLMRFARSLSASGHVVFIPEILEWTRLFVAPELAAPSIAAALESLRGRDDVDPNRIGVFGFSFGATQTLMTVTDPAVAQGLKFAVAWGGYSDVERVLRFAVTGEHELDGVREHIDPDPYGRWIFAGNYLTGIPGYENMTRTATALMTLAREAGRSGIYAGDPIHNTIKAELAGKLNPEERRIYELFAPVGPHDVESARELAHALAKTVVAQNPRMNPGPFLEGIRVPVMITHGRDDRLIPFTESLRLKRMIPRKKLHGCTITSLFSHSGGTVPQLGRIGLARESARFVNVLNRILTAL